MRVLHEARVRSGERPTTGGEPGPAKSRFGHHQDVLIVPFRNCVRNRDPRLRRFVGNAKLVSGRFQLTGVVGINPLYFATAAEPLKRFAGFLMSLVLHRD